MEQGCEDDIADTFHLPRTGPRARTSMAGSGKLQHQHQQQQHQQQDQQSAGESVYAMSDAAQQKEIDRLTTKLRQMESKLLSEEKARAAASVRGNLLAILPPDLTAAQERIVDMAEQLLEKDRLREILAAEVRKARQEVSGRVTRVSAGGAAKQQAQGKQEQD
jgi:predicted RNase H-like nuclease (RuvC/YqgF family)